MSAPTFETDVTVLKLERPGVPGSGSPGEALRDMLTRAHEYVTDLGYRVTECALTWRPTDDHTATMCVLSVRGVPCLEITVKASRWSNYESTVTTAPRLLGWPTATQDAILGLRP